MNQQFDVVVIGAGPGGYVAAIRAAQLGFKTACIDDFKGANDHPALGGTCLNMGCIPSKALLQSSENWYLLTHEFAQHGISAGKVQFDVAKMLARKDSIVAKLNAGVAYLFKKNKVTSFFGRGSFVQRQNDRWHIAVAQGKKTETLDATYVVIATGSRVRPLAGVTIDNLNILDNVGALALKHVPKRLGVIGAGVIGLEMGSVWRRLGSEVTLLEAAPTFLSGADQQIAQEALRTLSNETKLDIQLGVKIGAIKNAKTVSVDYQKDGQTKRLIVDKLIIAVGREPNTAGLNAAAVALPIDSRGYITVDDCCQTALPNIWAIGDVVRGPMLAHKAMEEGVAVAERIAGQKPTLDLQTIPWVIYTAPEIAWVGRTEEQLKAEKVPYNKGCAVFSSNGRALGLGHTQGMVKLLAHADTDRILGLHLIGPMVSELITEGVLALEFKASSEDIARIVHAHPSLSEALHEAALACQQRALHS